MKFVSSRAPRTPLETPPDAAQNQSIDQAQNQVSFATAILDCMPRDGGMYVPAYEEDLRRWILYLNEHTTFQSMAGALTEALIKDEFSPIIAEAIATKAFPFSPELRQLDENLFVLELFHGPTGNFKDFGISYLASCLEYVLLMQERTATVLAVTNGETGACITEAFRGKKHLKAVLLYTRGTARGYTEADLVQNGGNILPVEVDGTEEDCFELVRGIYGDPDLVEKYHLTLANTVNIGRVLPLSFCYMYAFSRLKKKVYGDIFYANEAGNYSNLVAGLYGWKFSLPVTGFIANCTDSLRLDTLGKCSLLDSMVPLHKRSFADPANPSSLERLEEVFTANPAVLKALVFPANVTEADKERAAKDAYMQYRYLMDDNTATAFAASRIRRDIVQEDDGAVVLLAKKHPALGAAKIKHWCGEVPAMPDTLARLYEKPAVVRNVPADQSTIVKLLEEV